MYLRESSVKSLIKKNGRRAGRDFLLSLDAYVEKLIIKSCEQKNGSKKTLDADVFNFVAPNIKGG